MSSPTASLPPTCPSRPPVAARVAVRTSTPPTPVQWVLIGARGQVARSLRAQAQGLLPALRASGLDLRLRAAFDRRGYASSPTGLEPTTLDEGLAPRREGDWPELRASLATEPAPTEVVDCTASPEVAGEYRQWFASGFGIVTPNKLANAGPLARWRRLHALAAAQRLPYRYETTVGAALPILGSVRTLVRRGEAPTRIEAVLSGSLSFLTERVQAGLPFAQALAEARARGLTEPDPREDLECRDLARKLLILARSAGIALEPAQLQVEPLIEAGERRFAAADARWRGLVDEARARGLRLVVVAEVEHGEGRIGLRALRPSHPLARLAPGENLVRLWTPIHNRLPITIGGPGAGAAVTAAGVLGDLVDAARQLAARVVSPVAAAAGAHAD